MIGGRIMNERYDFASIENKWQTKWAEEKTYKDTEDETKPKYYCLKCFRIHRVIYIWDMCGTIPLGM